MAVSGRRVTCQTVTLTKREDLAHVNVGFLEFLAFTTAKEWIWLHIV